MTNPLPIIAVIIALIAAQFWTMQSLKKTNKLNAELFQDIKATKDLVAKGQPKESPLTMQYICQVMGGKLLLNANGTPKACEGLNSSSGSSSTSNQIGPKGLVPIKYTIVGSGMEATRSGRVNCSKATGEAMCGDDSRLICNKGDKILRRVYLSPDGKYLNHAFNCQIFQWDNL